MLAGGGGGGKDARAERGPDELAEAAGEEGEASGVEKGRPLSHATAKPTAALESVRIAARSGLRAGPAGGWTDWVGVRETKVTEERLALRRHSCLSLPPGSIPDLPSARRMSSDRSRSDT